MNSAADKLYETSQLNFIIFEPSKWSSKNFTNFLILFHIILGPAHLQLIKVFSESETELVPLKTTWRTPKTLYIVSDEPALELYDLGSDDEPSLFYICANIYCYKHQSV